MLTVDLPTPPLPLPTAMTWRIPGSFSGLELSSSFGTGCAWVSFIVIALAPIHVRMGTLMQR